MHVDDVAVAVGVGVVLRLGLLGLVRIGVELHSERAGGHVAVQTGVGGGGQGQDRAVDVAGHLHNILEFESVLLFETWCDFAGDERNLDLINFLNKLFHRRRLSRNSKK